MEGNDGISSKLLNKSLRENELGNSFLVEDDEIEFETSGGDVYKQTNIIDDEDEDEGGYIRIRSQGDGIFEPEDDEEDEDDGDDEFYDFTIPEVELRSPPSRKRKQQLDCIDNELTDIIEVNDEEEPQYMDHEPMYTIDTTGFIPTKKRERLPLYLLNPEDFAHDPKKQMQIRRAIITYRHHQDKKEQIIKLTEENKKLRHHVSALKLKVTELSKCGCEKNESVSLDELNVVIPVVPPRMYVRGNRPILGVPYNKRAVSPTSLSKLPATVVKSEIDTTDNSRLIASTFVSKPLPPPAKFEVAKPLINITSTRLAGLSSSSLASNNIVTAALHKPPMRKVLPGGVTSVTLPLTKRNLTAGNLLHTGNRVSANRTTGLISLSTMKTEPGEFVPSPLAVKPGNLTAANITATTSAKDGLTSPATAAPVSRIVFAKKGNSSSSKIQTASQLIFGMKPITNHSNCIQTSQHSLQLPPSQMTFATQPKLDASPLRPLMNSRLTNKTGQVFTTASGQVLKLVQSAAARETPGKFLSIAPKPTKLVELDTEAIKREIERKQMEEMWKQLDNNGDDEMEIIAALSGSSPPQRNRKQAFGQRGKLEDSKRMEGTNTDILQSYEELELNKYEDIVFEEAD